MISMRYIRICQDGLRPILSHREGQCLSEAKKVPRLCKSTGIPKAIHKGSHISAGMCIHTRFRLFLSKTFRSSSLSIRSASTLCLHCEFHSSSDLWSYDCSWSITVRICWFPTGGCAGAGIYELLCLPNAAT